MSIMKWLFITFMTRTTIGFCKTQFMPFKVAYYSFDVCFSFLYLLFAQVFLLLYVEIKWWGLLGEIWPFSNLTQQDPTSRNID